MRSASVCRAIVTSRGSPGPRAAFTSRTAFTSRIADSPRLTTAIRENEVVLAEGVRGPASVLVTPRP
ncbi:hypothetical protein GCM10028777_17580 [Angustibacter speluncae]